MLPSPFVCLFVCVWGWGFRAGSPEDGGAAAEGRRRRGRERTARRGGGGGGGGGASLLRRWVARSPSGPSGRTDGARGAWALSLEAPGASQPSGSLFGLTW